MRNIYYTFPFLILADIASKYLAGKFLMEKIQLLGDWVYLEFTKNTGVAFSFAVHGMVLKILTLVLIFGIIYYYIKEEYKKKLFLVDSAFTLILAGAIGNAFERIFFGEVTDFIGVRYFAVFNLADSFLSIGVALYLIHLLAHKK